MPRHFAAFMLTLALGLPCAHQANAAELLIHKGKRTLTFTEGGLVREFPVSLGFTPAGAKLRQGDGKTPEGVYYITQKNPQSQFHLSLGISYPNIEDAKEGLRAKLISKKEYAAIEKAIRHGLIPPQKTRMGGAIYIHGGGTQTDWTWGCIALSNADMDFLYSHMKPGDKVTILK